MERKSVLITDLDNTLYDWVDIWYHSFEAMLSTVVKMSGISRETLITEIRPIHQRAGTSEYFHLLEEIPALKQKHPDDDLADVYAPAIQAFREARSKALALYPDVWETLRLLAQRGVLLIGYTESQAFYTNFRMRKLHLDTLLDYLHSPPDHAMPRGLTKEQIRKYPQEHYDFDKTQHHHTPEGELKPNPRVLLDIIADVGAQPTQAVYVGDSLMKDVKMAQDAGVTDVWAKYGKAQNRPEYQLLRDVTHWTDAQVERERSIEQHVTPSYVLEHSLKELFDLFSFVPFDR